MNLVAPGFLNSITALALRAMALAFNRSKRLQGFMRCSDGWINFSVGIRTETGTVAQTISFNDGRVTVRPGVNGRVDVTLIPRDDNCLKEMATVPPNEMLNMMLRNQIMIDGNMAYLQLFNFYLSLLVGKHQQRSLDRAHRADMAGRKKDYAINDPALADELKRRRTTCLRADGGEDKNVKYLSDPYLGEYRLHDYPRLATLLERHLTARPELCPERPALLTAWYREHGFEENSKGEKWQPALRQGLAFRHLMGNKKALVAEGQLLAGTSTTNPDCGVIVYPDAQGTMAWGELNSIDRRYLNPYNISAETRKILADIFPFWARRNFRELVRDKFNKPLGQQIDERFVAYFCWKSVGLSHTVPDFRTILEEGTEGIVARIKGKLEKAKATEEERTVLGAMIECLEGLAAYGANLSRCAAEKAASCGDLQRREELLEIAARCAKVPCRPADSLAEAVQSIWTTWVGLHMENTNTGLSLGRLDQWLQPYFLADMTKIAEDEERRSYIRLVIELIGCLYLRIVDHMPLSPDIGNYLFGGSPADQAITLGGITPQGEDGVNDMTYIFLKVTEMLTLHDPNVNARITPGINSDTYIRRLCDVNYTASGTPSLHNDEAVFASLRGHSYPEEHIRDWCAIGCVEPTIAGRHSGHTGSILMNLVAAMEMALNNGRHPLMQWDLGPQTGSVDQFESFEQFFAAYAAQQRFLIKQAVTLNNMYAEIHAEARPTPLLSALVDDCIDRGLDITGGGALYNSSGSSNIGLADITDSLLVIKKLVFDDKKLTFGELKAALDDNFAKTTAIKAMIENRVPLFGSGQPEAVAIANRVAALLHGLYSAEKNYRGGPYTCGFWSMSQHVAYGNLSGSLPSGRPAGKAFTPGLTPQPHAGSSYLSFITDVAALEPENIDNNMAFNVKIAPSPADSRKKINDVMTGYVKTYLDLGGMQMQFNVVSSDVLKDAMANPENYRNLIVRISGYNAYFVTLNKQQQIELIERAEYRV